jgi:hypothetical protein
MDDGVEDPGKGWGVTLKKNFGYLKGSGGFTP